MLNNMNFSKNKYRCSAKENILRRDVIYSTFIRAIECGDENVYFIDGQGLFKGEYRDCCTVDGCHPNDAGFVRMAETIGNMVFQINLA